MRVLIADDEKTLASMIKEILSGDGFDCDVVYNGRDALNNAQENQYDLIILDIMMPILSGMEALKELRGQRIATPLLILSARSQTSDKVEGLNLGADDYLAKPFAREELLARVKALTRRRSEFPESELVFGDLTLDKNTLRLRCFQSEVKLSSTEFKIMDLLMSNPKIIIKKDRLVDRVWGYYSESEYNNAEVYVSFLRKKLSALGSKVAIKATRGIGYSLVVEQ